MSRLHVALLACALIPVQAIAQQEHSCDEMASTLDRSAAGLASLISDDSSLEGTRETSESVAPPHLPWVGMELLAGTSGTKEATSEYVALASSYADTCPGLKHAAGNFVMWKDHVKELAAANEKADQEVFDKRYHPSIFFVQVRWTDQDVAEARSRVQDILSVVRAYPVLGRQSAPAG